MSNDQDGISERLLQEYHRGTLTMVVLSLLEVQHYGYALVQELQAAGMEVTQDTVYPLLRRLEQQGLLSSEWIVEGSRPRKYYRTSPKGVEVVKRLKTQWLSYTETIRRIIT